MISVSSGGETKRRPLIKSVTLIEFALKNKALVILAVLCIIMSFASDVFLTTANLINVTRQVAITAIVGVGFTFIVACGALDLSVDTQIALLGIISAQLSKIEGMPLVVAFALTLLVGIMLGTVAGFIVTQFNLPPVVVTLGMQLAYRGASNLLCNASPVLGIKDFQVWLGQGHVSFIPVPVVLLIVIVLIFAAVLYRTKYGRYVIATGANQSAALVSGVNVKFIRMSVHVVLSVCIAIASIILTGRVRSAQPNAGTGTGTDAICAVVLGGTRMGGGNGKVTGTVFGCLIVGVINNGLNLMNINMNWQYIVKGALIVLSIVIDASTENVMSRIYAKQLQSEKDN